MKVKMMMAVLLATFFVGSTVDAAYVVYKTKNQVQPYSLTGANWGKDEKLTVETYTVFKVVGGAVVTTETPQRIVIFKPAKGEAAYDFYGRKLTKLMMDPQMPAEYVGSILATQYIPYFGDWDVSVANSTTDKSYMFIYSYAVETAGDPIDRFGESYSGVVKAFTIASGSVTVAAAPSLKGSLSYVSGDLPLIPDAAGEDLGKGTLKYDKASTVFAAAQGSMDVAVGAVVEYLWRKGYNSTWNE